MFSDGDDVLLGIPECSSQSVDSFTSSKIGGRPCWISEQREKEGVNPQCGLCQRIMTFVMQVYAPTDDLERCLYMYCCPSRCAGDSNGWIVLKDQRIKEVLHEKTSEKLSSPLTPTDWVAVCNPQGADSRATSQGWNINKEDDEVESDGDDDDFAALSAMIDARDGSLLSTHRTGSTHGTLSAKKDTPHLPPTPAFQKKSETALIDKGTIPVVSVREVYESEYSNNSSASDVSSTHVEELLEKYIKETISEGEEDPNIISLLQQQQKKKKTVNNDSEDDDDFDDNDDDDFNSSIRQLQSLRRTAQNTKSSDSCSSNNISKGKNALSKTEWQQKKKSEEFYQKRVSIAPSQVMRYAYGGCPLWATIPSPPIDNMPNCPSCGDCRVFELQIMPAVINYIDKLFTTDDAATHCSVSKEFDFGVATVWSCPKSCEGVPEFVLVQPTSDEY